MESKINLYKKVGETPLQRLDRFRKEKPAYKDKKMTYAGRLDPIAEGVLLVLTGEECKSKEDYLKLPKEYVFEVVFGIETDTYDILGKILNVVPPPDDIIQKVERELGDFEGEIKQEYPPFSSKTVEGKPLFEWAKEGRIKEIKLPKKKNKIYNIFIEDTRMISVAQIRDKVKHVISDLKGDFRQHKILENWEELNSRCAIEFPAVSIRVECSSGTYVRDIASKLGKQLGTCATTVSIKREKLGEHSSEDSI